MSYEFEKHSEMGGKPPNHFLDSGLVVRYCLLAQVNMMLTRTRIRACCKWATVKWATVANFLEQLV